MVSSLPSQQIVCRLISHFKTPNLLVSGYLRLFFFLLNLKVAPILLIKAEIKLNFPSLEHVFLKQQADINKNRNLNLFEKKTVEINNPHFLECNTSYRVYLFIYTKLQSIYFGETLCSQVQLFFLMF